MNFVSDVAYSLKSLECKVQYYSTCDWNPTFYCYNPLTMHMGREVVWFILQIPCRLTRSC